MARFNMRDLMAGFSAPQTEEKAAQGPAWEITMIPLEKIIPSEKNKYGIRGIEELAESIRESGLLHNLVVRKCRDGDGYELISGERRYRALRLLYESGESQWKSAPCKVETAANDIFAELQLLVANMQTRELTDYEKVYQAHRAKEILHQLKQQGHTFRGRTRENVACLLGVSNAQIGRMESIWNHLEPEAMQKFKDGQLGISAAYELSRKGKAEQVAALRNDPPPQKEKPERQALWSRQDIQDARSILRLFPNAEMIERKRTGDLVVCCSNGERIGVCNQLFPLLLPSMKIEIERILQEKEGKR